MRLCLAVRRRTDPATIAKYTVLRIPYKFSDGDKEEPKRFVLLGHTNEAAILLKATSNPTYYEARPELLPGVVSCPKGYSAHFGQPTFVQVDNYAAVFHSKLARLQAQGRLEILGDMPECFHDDLAAAVKASTVLNNKGKLAMLAMMGYVEPPPPKT